MAWTVDNAWPDIAMLRTDESIVDSSFTTETALRLELYTAMQEIDFDDYTVSVGFSKLTLQLECDGTEVAIGNRYGDPVPVNEIISSQKVTDDFSVKGGVSADTKFQAGPVGASLDAKAQAYVEANGTSTRSRETTSNQTMRHVTAGPNDKWIISSLNGQALDQKYLTDGIELCKIRPLPRANRASLDIHLAAHKRDLVFEISDQPNALKRALSKITNNKEKILKVLLAKSITTGQENLDKSAYIQLSKISNVEND